MLVGLLAAGPEAGAVPTPQLIRIRILTRTEVKVDGKPTPIAALEREIAGLVQGNHRARVDVFVRVGTRASDIRRIMEACRRGGAAAIKVVVVN